MKLSEENLAPQVIFFLSIISDVQGIKIDYHKDICIAMPIQNQAYSNRYFLLIAIKHLTIEKIHLRDRYLFLR